MAFKNCTMCKHCVIKPIKHQTGMINLCKLEDRIAKLTLEELAARFASNVCDWFEAGEPEYSDEPCYED